MFGFGSCSTEQQHHDPHISYLKLLFFFLFRWQQKEHFERLSVCSEDTGTIRQHETENDYSSCLEPSRTADGSLQPKQEWRRFSVDTLKDHRSSGRDAV